LLQGAIDMAILRCFLFPAKTHLWALVSLLSLAVGLPDRPLVAQESTQEAPVDGLGEEVLPEEVRYQRLTKMLTNVKLVGHFTIDGKPLKDLQEEAYEIKSAKKLPDGDLWMLICRIQYGGKDVSLPLALPIQWSGNTPVISLEKFTIPGMGTFSARVVLHDGKYAGTWSHDAVGGHLFGRIEPL
jgi:hypothetical protein